MTRSLSIAAAVGLIAGVGLAVALYNGALTVPDWVSQRTTGQALVGGPFELVDHSGKTVRDSDFRGQYMLIYFGFAHCPDVCPSALQVMSAALDKIGSEAERITPIFISVDPERDTPESLAAYVSAFHPKLVGLTGSPEAVSKAATAYRVFYRKVQDPGSAGDYTVDHSSIIYFMDPDGRFITHFTHGTPVDVMAEKLQGIV